MIEPWNNSLLQPPPINTCLFSNLDFSLSQLRDEFKDIIECLSSQGPFHKECAIISRLIYIFDKKFRNDIGYLHLKKTNVVLRRYLKLNLLNDARYFDNTLPQDTMCNIYLPTKQMLEYVLVRLQSFSKLLVRAIVCSKKASILYFDRVKRGEGHWMSFMPYVVLCRIWSLSSFLLKKSCKWYNNLFPYLRKFKPLGLQFLPNNYKLPESLEDWLEIDSLEEIGRLNWAKNKTIEVVSALEGLSAENDDKFDIIEYMKQAVQEFEEDNKNKLKAVTKSSNKITYENEITNFNPNTANSNEDTHSESSTVIIDRNTNIDIGETVSRDDFLTAGNKTTILNIYNLKLESTESIDEGSSLNIHGLKINKKELSLSNLENKKSKRIKTQLHSSEHVKNVKHLISFISREDELRNNGSKESLTSHLSFMQWLALKTAMEHVARGKEGRSDVVISKKFKKIWRTKCLNYL